MIVHRLSDYSYMFTFTEVELLEIRAASKEGDETVKDCLTAFFSGCLSGLNNVLDRKDGTNGLER